MPWWDHDQAVAGRNDARDAFARLVPMDPLPYENLPALRTWLRIPPAEFDESLTNLPEPVLPNEEAGPGPRGPEDSGSSASTPGLLPLLRPRPGPMVSPCTGSRRFADGSVQRSRDVYDRIRLLPMNRLDEEDRYRFLAWLLLLTDLTDTSFADPLARWLVDHGTADDERLKDWSRPIAHRIGSGNLASEARIARIHPRSEGGSPTIESGATGETRAGPLEAGRTLPYDGGA